MQDPDFVIPLLDKRFTLPIKKQFLDISYSNASSNCKLDIYIPNVGTKPYPVIVYFHGGAFMIGTRKDDALEPMLRGVGRGYAVISVDYRLSKEARFPAMIYDAKTAIRFVRAKAKEYDLDQNKIAVWGPSSGGWITSMLDATNGDMAFEDLSLGYEESSSDVEAVVDWCGPSSGFDKMDYYLRSSKVGVPDHDDPKSPESLFLGHSIQEVKELCHLSSPIAHVKKGIPPFCLIHGEIDQVVPVEMSIDLAKKIQSVDGRDDLHVEKGKRHHGDPWYNETWVSDICLDFLDDVFKRKSHD